MTVRVLECSRCGESSIVDTWPGDDSDNALEAIIRAEEWTYTGDLELCPECSGGSDER